MYELSLFGSVAADRHSYVLQQLAGLAGMQPREVREIHLIFKARVPPGLEKVQATGGSSSTPQQQQELQKVKSMLQSGIYHVKLVGSIALDTRAKEVDKVNGDNMAGVASQRLKVDWTFEFKDTPEAGKQQVTTRLISRTKFDDGDLVGFLNLLGYDYANRYIIEGHVFYAQDMSLLLHRLRRLPKADDAVSAADLSKLGDLDNLQLLDYSGAYILQATVDITDGNSQDLRDRATRQLIGMRDALQSEVSLLQPDRLALDTRIPIPLRRV